MHKLQENGRTCSILLIFFITASKGPVTNYSDGSLNALLYCPCSLFLVPLLALSPSGDYFRLTLMSFSTVLYTQLLSASWHSSCVYNLQAVFIISCLMFMIFLMISCQIIGTVGISWSLISICGLVCLSFSLLGALVAIVTARVPALHKLLKISQMCPNRPRQGINYCNTHYHLAEVIITKWDLTWSRARGATTLGTDFLVQLQ